MTAALFDTNILIDLLRKVPAAIAEIEATETIAISVMTWMEVMVGTSPATDADTRRLLGEFEVIALDSAIAERAVGLRRGSRIKLDDAIIWATAQTRDLTLVTRNTKDFPPGTAGVRVPYAV